jgi:hypothetical protein
MGLENVAAAVKSPADVIVPYCDGITIHVVALIPDCCTVNCCCWDGPSVAIAGLIWACAVALAHRKAIDRKRNIGLYGMFRFL